MALGALIGAVGGLLGSRSQNRSNERIAERSYQESREGLLLGNQLDIDSQKEMFDFRMGRMRQAGLTNVEMFGSPAAGAGGGTSGSGATLGNAASQRATSQIAANSQMQAQMNQAMLGAGTALEQTKMQTEASKDVAKIQAGATTGAAQIGADAQKYIYEGNMQLKRDVFNQIDLPAAQQALKTSKAKTQVAINEIVTSAPKYQAMMKRWSMGPKNILAEYFQLHHNIDFQDPKTFLNRSFEDRELIITKMVALDSLIGRETKGLTDAVDTKATSLAEAISSVVKNPVGLHEAIEMTDSAKEAYDMKVLGKGTGPEFRGPFHTGPNMSVR